MDEDFAYLAQKFPWLKEEADRVQRRQGNRDGDPVRSRNRSSRREGDVSAYLGQLSEETRRRLCLAFQKDFTLFGYQCDGV